MPIPTDFFALLDPDEVAPCLNTTLAGIATVVQAALPAVPVYAWPVTIDAEVTFPLIQIAPWHYRVQEIGSAERGNLPLGGGGVGPNHYLIILLWSQIPLAVGEPTANRALNKAVTTIISAWSQDGVYALPDAQGTPQVMDSAALFDANFGQQGSVMKYRGIDYLGCYITIDVMELDRP